MSFDWLDQLTRVIDREYERRIRAASEIVEYGIGHGHGHDHHHGSDAHAEAEDDGSVIMNVRPGTKFGGTGNRGRRPSQDS